MQGNLGHRLQNQVIASVSDGQALLVGQSQGWGGILFLCTLKKHHMQGPELDF